MNLLNNYSTLVGHQLWNQLVLNFVFVPGNNLVEYCCKPKKVKLALLLFDKVNV